MLEPTRQSLSGCCSQPEHGPTLATKCHRGRKRTWPDRDSNRGSLAYRASTLPLSYRATRSTGYNLPLLNQICPRNCSEPCQNRRDSLFQVAAGSPSTDPRWPPNVTGAEKERGPTGTRTQGLSLTVRVLYH